MIRDNFPQIEILALLLILAGSCDVKANIPDKPPIVELEPGPFGTWLSGRFVEWPDAFELELIRLEEKEMARGEQ